MDEGQNPAPEVGAAKRKLTDNDTFPLRGASRPAQLSETQKCSGESNEGKAESGMGATRNGHTKGDSNTGRTGCSPVQIDATSLDATLASADSSVLNPGEGRSVKGVSQHAEADERVGEEKEICRSPSPDVHGMSQLRVQKASDRGACSSPLAISPSLNVPSPSPSGVPSPMASNFPSPAPPTPTSSAARVLNVGAGSTKPKPVEGLATIPFPARASKDYVCIKSCGAGSFGEVYKVARRSDQRILAIKVLEGDQWAFEEASILRQLDHECICKLYDCFQCPEDGVTCLVMQYASGGDLLERVTNSGPLTEPAAVDLCKQLLQALKHMHGKGVVHRDLKPENVLYSADGKPLLADFGVGKRLRASLPPEDPVESLLTGGGGAAGSGKPGLRNLCLSDNLIRTHTQQIGTLGYSAPEVNSEQGHSFAADIWSLGAMFYVLLCGYHPFDMGDDEPNIIQERVRKGQVLPMQGEAWVSISDEAKDFVSRCLTVDISRRATLADCLAHPWLSKDFMQVVELVDAFTRLQVYHSSRRQSRSAAAAETATRFKRKRETSVASDEGSAGSLTPTPSKNFKAIMRDQTLPATVEVSFSESLDLSLSDGEHEDTNTRADLAQQPATSDTTAAAFAPTVHHRPLASISKSSGSKGQMRTAAAAFCAAGLLGSQGARGGGGSSGGAASGQARAGSKSSAAMMGRTNVIDINGVGDYGSHSHASRGQGGEAASRRLSAEKERGKDWDNAYRERERKRVHSAHDVGEAASSDASHCSNPPLVGGGAADSDAVGVAIDGDGEAACMRQGDMSRGAKIGGTSVQDSEGGTMLFGLAAALKANASGRGEADMKSALARAGEGGKSADGGLGRKTGVSQVPSTGEAESEAALSISPHRESCLRPVMQSQLLNTQKGPHTSHPNQQVASPHMGGEAYANIELEHLSLSGSVLPQHTFSPMSIGSAIGAGHGQPSLPVPDTQAVRKTSPSHPHTDGFSADHSSATLSQLGNTYSFGEGNAGSKDTGGVGTDDATRRVGGSTLGIGGSGTGSARRQSDKLDRSALCPLPENALLRNSGKDTQYAYVLPDIADKSSHAGGSPTSRAPERPPLKRRPCLRHTSTGNSGKGNESSDKGIEEVEAEEQEKGFMDKDSTEGARGGEGTSSRVHEKRGLDTLDDIARSRVMLRKEEGKEGGGKLGACVVLPAARSVSRDRDEELLVQESADDSQKRKRERSAEAESVRHAPFCDNGATPQHKVHPAAAASQDPCQL